VTGPVYQFGAFRLDERTRVLTRDGEPVAITPKVLDTLLFLVSNAGRTVSRDELIQAVWPDTFVEEGNLNYNMSQLRKLLGDDYVRTVPKVGYRFAAMIDPVKTVAEPVSTAKSKRFWILAAAAFMIAAGVVAVWSTKFAGSRTPQIRSIAVLPLRNLSRDPDQQYFTDGMTEALTTGLAQMSALTVIARSSMTRYGETKKTASEIAREVQVDALVEGSVQRAGGRVKITVRLIEGDRNLWAKSYERDVRDVLGLQNEVAQAIAEEIGARVVPQEQGRLHTRRPATAEAQESYLWGLYWAARKGADEKSLNYLQQATRQDQGYAPAYAALATAYANAVARGAVPPTEGYPKQMAALTKALELDGTLAEAHNSLAVLLEADWNWRDAEKEHRRALELNPNLSDAHAAYSYWLVRFGRMDEAIAEAKRVIRLDPYSLSGPQTGPHMLAEYLVRARRYDEAIQRIHKTLEESNLTPFDVGMERVMLGTSYLQKGLSSQAREELEQAVRLNEPDAFLRMMAVGSLAHAYGVTGRRKDALRELDRLKQMQPLPDRPFQIALVYTTFGDKDRAFQWLNEACAQRSYLITFIKVDPRFDALRSDLRYPDLLRRIGLPE
jgi:TolB-like protein/DNA-binding winged helix-turn-helix (wHTH) protein/Tfp pilus assembly protein PilF